MSRGCHSRWDKNLKLTYIRKNKCNKCNKRKFKIEQLEKIFLKQHNKAISKYLKIIISLYNLDEM